MPKQQPQTHLCLAGEMLTPLVSGGLWWEKERVLVVSDLHLEKGSSYAKRGQMLPPYDTSATLEIVAAACRDLEPDIVISLGDSFHDRSAELRLSNEDTARICALTDAHDWVWVEGNHDPDPPAHLCGRAEKKPADWRSRVSSRTDWRARRDCRAFTSSSESAQQVGSLGAPAMFCQRCELSHHACAWSVHRRAQCFGRRL